MKTKSPLAKDEYSYSVPEDVRVRHIDLDLAVLFESRVLQGTALLILNAPFSGNLVLDTRDLVIESVEYSRDNVDFRSAVFRLGGSDAIKGAPLAIALPESAVAVRIRYQTSPDASGLQWLAPMQTAGKDCPFLFTQSEATHARSWIPLQDTPQVRSTYRAHIHIPRNLKAVMSASNNLSAYAEPDPIFSMVNPIPSYLIALAVGDLEFRDISGRTGVFAERPVIDRAAHEFEDLDRMLQAGEELFGPYRWGRYDLLVLPPSFPVGGMENPCLTFTTPTIIAGDKSLSSLIIHELAHSWSSNLINNATWDDFWINEGFTVYMERRIVEKLYGQRRAEMESVLAMQELERELLTSLPEDQVLHRQARGRDPNIGFSLVPYEKGALFLRRLEEIFGRARFDAFLREYIDHFAFQSISTSRFVDYLSDTLLCERPDAAPSLSVEQWIYAPGLPKTAPRPISDALANVEHQASQWLQGAIALKDIQTDQWSTQELLHFLRYSSGQIDTAGMEALDREFRLTSSGNAELQFQWLVMAIEKDYQPAYKRVEEFLNNIGRRKYVKPLYRELVKTPEGRQWALAIYKKARPRYHPITRAAVNEVLREGRS